MALNLNFNFGQGFGAPGCGCGGGNPGFGGGMGMPGMGGMPGMAGVPGMAGMGGMDPMMAMNSQMMNMFTMTMMAMMTQLMQMIGGGAAMPGGPGQFGGGMPGGSPLNNFLGGDGGGGGSVGGGGGGGGAIAPTGNGTSLGPADGSTSPKTKKFMDLALAQQGKPYVFGAAGPSAFDCSGLVSWALKEAGVSGGRTTARGLQDRYKGSAITRKEDLKPGDLVFFWSPNTRGIPKGQASHVEIYLGNGKTMGTDSPSEGARVEPINWSTFIGGARVPQLQG